MYTSVLAFWQNCDNEGGQKNGTGLTALREHGHHKDLMGTVIVKNEGNANQDRHRSHRGK